MTELSWMREARSLVGLKEIPGERSNQTIIGWAKQLGGWIASFYKNDDVPWCGLFVSHVMQVSGFKVTINNPLGALNWLKYGKSTSPRYGAIMCFRRSGGGHVGFYVSEDDNYYHILGGNQSNSVSITKVAKDRYAGARWPLEDSTQTERIHKKFDGKVTTNEA